MGPRHDSLDQFPYAELHGSMKRRAQLDAQANMQKKNDPGQLLGIVFSVFRLPAYVSVAKLPMPIRRSLTRNPCQSDRG